MHSFIYRRKSRLSGVVSLFDLAMRSWPPDPAGPELPTSARLRRDMGLPEAHHPSSRCAAQDHFRPSAPPDTAPHPRIRTILSDRRGAGHCRQAARVAQAFRPSPGPRRPDTSPAPQGNIPMTLTRIGGVAALVCAATYLVGFAFLVTLLAPLGFGTNDIDAAAVVAFIDARPGFLFAWNTGIYVVNALALVILVVVLSEWQAKMRPGWAAVIRVFGVVWATLVLGAGMIANVAVERAAHLYPTDPGRAADLWDILHHIELGLGGGNEIAGGVWIGCVSFAGLISRSLPKITVGLGLLTGGGGLLTMISAIGDMAGALFGLGATAWFIAIALTIFFNSDPASDRAAT